MLVGQGAASWSPVFLGVADVFAAIGITLPSLTGILPWLASWAAPGVMLLFLMAAFVVYAH